MKKPPPKIPHGPSFKNLRGKRGSDHDSAGRSSRNINAPSQTDKGDELQDSKKLLNELDMSVVNRDEVSES